MTSLPPSPLPSSSATDPAPISPAGQGHQPKPASPLTRFLFLKTVFAILLTVLLVVGGGLGYGSMIKESNPEIAVAIASITTTWGGADPETIEQQVTN